MVTVLADDSQREGYLGRLIPVIVDPPHMNLSMMCRWRKLRDEVELHRVDGIKRSSLDTFVSCTQVLSVENALLFDARFPNPIWTTRVSTRLGIGKPDEKLT